MFFRETFFKTKLIYKLNNLLPTKFSVALYPEELKTNAIYEPSVAFLGHSNLPFELNSNMLVLPIKNQFEAGSMFINLFGQIKRSQRILPNDSNLINDWLFIRIFLTKFLTNSNNFSNRTGVHEIQQTGDFYDTLEWSDKIKPFFYYLTPILPQTSRIYEINGIMALSKTLSVSAKLESTKFQL